MRPASGAWPSGRDRDCPGRARLRDCPAVPTDDLFRRPDTLVEPARQLTSWLRTPSVFSDHRLQRFLVQAQIRHQLAKSGVLIAKLLGFPHEGSSRPVGTGDARWPLRREHLFQSPCGGKSKSPEHICLFIDHSAIAGLSAFRAFPGGSLSLFSEYDLCELTVG